MESVCDDPDVIAANILVGDIPSHHHLFMPCVCVGGGGVGSQPGNEREK